MNVEWTQGSRYLSSMAGTGFTRQLSGVVLIAERHHASHVITSRSAWKTFSNR